MKKPGYREMLRDRCPKVVSYALKWKKAKERWIDHAYNYFVKIVGEERNIDDKLIRSASENKKMIARILLGISNGKTKYFDFDKTIDWDNLSDEDTVFWKNISSWVKWFGTNYACVKNTYDISLKSGNNIVDTKVKIIKTWLTWLLPKMTEPDEIRHSKYDYLDKFVDYLIRCFEENN